MAGHRIWASASRYTNYVTTPIADVTFTVPTSDPTFGVCKQCGKDPACGMDYCTE